MSPLLTGLTWLLVFQCVGEVLVRATGAPVPGPVVGMVLLFALLRWRAARAAAATAAAGATVAPASATAATLAAAKRLPPCPPDSPSPPTGC